MAFPDIPPYVVRLAFPTAGQAVLFPFSPIRPETVLVAVTPSAFPRRYYNSVVGLNCIPNYMPARTNTLNRNQLGQAMLFGHGCN